MNVLGEILDHKRREIDAAVARVSCAEMASRALGMRERTRPFQAALERAAAPVIIAEIKRRSPSKGLIRADFDAVACAQAYERGGAAALSVLTDSHYFGGELAYLAQVRQAVALPLLRKDFTIDAYQIDEARVAGADAVLLIAAALSPDQLSAYRKRAEELGLDALVEVHAESELEVALAAGATLVGVNNRDLRSFHVDLGISERIASKLAALGRSDVLCVAESGIRDADDLTRLTRAGARAFLVGETLMREADVEKALRRLRRTS